jgi:uncharacterized protein YhaN
LIKGEIILKIKEIKINNYGNLENKDINLKNKINIIYGKNESGKSTLLSYIKNIFYGISKNKNGKDISDYEKYKPWGKVDYSGKLKYELDNGQEFEIFRDFNKKNPKIFNENMEEISDKFNIIKKDGTQFFYEQTNVDETMFTSTVVSMQSEVKLDKQEQNILVQKLANLAGTGDDSLSYKKVVDKLNKMQIEEIGTERSQNRPINIINDRLKTIENVINELQEYQKDKELTEAKKSVYASQIYNLENELEALKSLKIILLHKQNNEEKINIKNNYKKEKLNKKIDLNTEKDNLIARNKIKKDKTNKKVNFKKYILIMALILIINVVIYFVNENTIKNNILGILNYCLIPIYLILVFLIEFNKSTQIKKVINKEQEEFNNELVLLDKQIEIIDEEIRKINKEIESEQASSDNEIEVEINNLRESLEGKINIDELLDNVNEKNIDTITYEAQDKLNKNKVELQTIKYEENNISEKLENLATLKEEFDKLVEDKEELIKRNNEINLAKNFLNEAYINMKNSITPKFTENMSKNISKISNNKYTKVGINEEKGLIVENEFGEYIPAERLSIGTIDQLYLSLRLSMIDDLSEENLPIILDEAFAYYDDYRLENILKFLNENMNNHQVIIFTCTKREQEILNKNNIEYNLVNI